MLAHMRRVQHALRASTSELHAAAAHSTAAASVVALPARTAAAASPLSHPGRWAHTSRSTRSNGHKREQGSGRPVGSVLHQWQREAQRAREKSEPADSLLQQSSASATAALLIRWRSMPPHEQLPTRANMTSESGAALVLRELALIGHAHAEAESVILDCARLIHNDPDMQWHISIMNAWLDCYSAAGEWAAGELVWSRIRKLQLHPTAETFFLLMRIYMRTGDPSQLAKVPTLQAKMQALNAERRHSLVFTPAQFSELIGAACVLGPTGDAMALRWAREAHSSELMARLPVHTHELLHDVYQRAQSMSDDRALFAGTSASDMLQQWDAMSPEMRARAPPYFFPRLHIRLVRARMISQADRIMSQYMELAIPWNLRTVRAWLSCYAHPAALGQLSAAEAAWAWMLQQRLKPTPAVYQIMFRVLMLEGTQHAFKRIEQLYEEMSKPDETTGEQMRFDVDDIIQLLQTARVHYLPSQAQLWAQRARDTGVWDALDPPTQQLAQVELWPPEHLELANQVDHMMQVNSNTNPLIRPPTQNDVSNSEEGGDAWSPPAARIHTHSASVPAPPRTTPHPPPVQYHVPSDDADDADPLLRRLRAASSFSMIQDALRSPAAAHRLSTEVRVANAALDGYVLFRSWRAAEELWRVMGSQGPAPNAASYRAMICLYLRCRSPQQLAKIEPLYAQMQGGTHATDNTDTHAKQESTDTPDASAPATAAPSPLPLPPAPAAAPAPPTSFSSADLNVIIVCAGESMLDAQVLRWARRAMNAVDGPMWEQSTEAHYAVKLSIKRVRKRLRAASERTQIARKRAVMEAQVKAEQRRAEQEETLSDMAEPPFSTPPPPPHVSATTGEDLYTQISRLSNTRTP